MATVTIEVPEGALSALRLSPAEFVSEMRLAAALLWYSQGDISQSKGAEIAGTSGAEFIDQLAHRRIPVVQVTAEELSEEVEAARQADVARRVAELDNGVVKTIPWSEVRRRLAER